MADDIVTRLRNPILATRVPDLCPDCKGDPRVRIDTGYEHGDSTPCSHPNAPTISDLLRGGTNVAKARADADMVETFDDVHHFRGERDAARAEASVKGYRLDDALAEIKRLRALIVEWNAAKNGAHWEHANADEWHAACDRLDAAEDALSEEAHRG